MAQEGFDDLMALTDSRYELSMITARRAAQLKAGIPSTLDSEEYPRTRNTVTVAMKELETHSGILWGDDLPSTDELKQVVERERREDASGYSVSHGDEDE